MSSSIYGTVVFDLTFFTEVTRSDNILKSIEANVIIGLPDIRSHRLVHRIPPQGTSQDGTPPTLALLVRRDTRTTSRAICQGSLPCSNCLFLIARGHDNTLCSVAGRPHTPQCRDSFTHRMFTDDELIKKKDIFDPIQDDDDIDWKYNPFDVDLIDEAVESPEQLMSQITFEGSPQLQKIQYGVPCSMDRL